MKQRDDTREQIKKARNGEKVVLSAKYKKLRNQVNCKIRKECILHNEKRVEKANSEGEIWKIVNEVVKPKKVIEWSIKKEDDSTTLTPLKWQTSSINSSLKNLRILKLTLTSVVYFDQLSGACSTRKLVETFFSAVFRPFLFISDLFSDFTAEINKK